MRKTYVVRITTSLSFAAFTAKLADCGDVEHVGIKDATAPAASGPVPSRVNGRPVKNPNRYSAEGLASLRAAAVKNKAERRRLCIETLAGVLRSNAHAPLFKLADLMNATDIKPTRNGRIPWTETSVRGYIDEALALVTDPAAPRPEG